MRPEALLVLACLLLASGPSLGEEPAGASAMHRNCFRSGQLKVEQERGPWKSSFLPRSDLFDPNPADPRQPRTSGTYLKVWFLDHNRPPPGPEAFIGGFVSVGGDFGLWGLREEGGCDGVQIEAETAVFAQFDMNTISDDLINVDFFVSAPITFRRGMFSGRFRVFHQSSHIGDEFLAFHPGIRFSEFSMNGVDLTAALEDGWWRIYLGIGGIFSSDPRMDPLLLSGGLELFGPAWSGGGGPFSVSTLLALDFQSVQERNFGVTGTGLLGVELASGDSSRRVRVGVQAIRGFLPFGRFTLTERVQTVGVNLQLII